MGEVKSYLKAAPPRTTGPMASVLLFLIILAIGVGPRLRFGGGGGEPIDIRVQDILLIPAMLHLLTTRRPDAPPPLTTMLRWAVPVFVWGSCLITAISIMEDPSVSIFRRVAFAGRGVELFVLAMVIAGLYLRSRSSGMRVVRRAIYLSAIGNIAWVAYQLATGTTGTLLTPNIGDDIQAYGPQLIGEGSAFGTGQFFAFVAAFGVAEMRSRTSRSGWLLVIIGAVGAVASMSRISITGVLIAFLILTLFSRAKGALLNVGAVIFLVPLGILALLTFSDELTGRLSPHALSESLGFRYDEVWGPLVDTLTTEIWTGLGPGALLPPLPIEAHNVLLRAVIDYGLIIGLVFVGIFAATAIKAYREGKEDHTPDGSLFANYAFIAIGSVLVAGLVQDSLTGVMSSHLAMVSIGLFAATYSRRHSDPPPFLN